MSKDKIRNVMPPTTRNFETRTAHIESQLAHIRERVDRIEQTNAIAASRAEYTLFATLESLCQNADTAPRILLAGWYGAENYGDELMMETVLSYLPENVRSQTTVLLWDNEAYPIGKLDPLVKVLHYPPTTEGIQALSALFDVVVWGGGAIIDDVQYDERPINHATGNLFIRLSQRMIAQGKSVYCLSLSASDTLDNTTYLSALQTIIDRSAYFSLRDPHSLETLTNAGLDVSRVQLDNDIAFANKQLQKLSAERTNVRNASEQPAIGLVFHCFDELEEFNYQLICDVVSMIENHDDGFSAGSHVLLIPFYNEGESDRKHLDRLAERFKAEHAEDSTLSVAPYESDLQNSPLLACSLIISCRYHASLIAGCLGIPFVAICNDAHTHYPNKTKYLLEQFYPEENASERMLKVSDYSKEKLTRTIELQCENPVSAEVRNALFKDETNRLITALSFLPTSKE